MKRILMVFAVMMLSITAFSQSTPNRLLVVDKTGGYKGFMIERLDSIVFRSVEGRVAADVEFLGYEKDNSGASKVRCSVTRTPDCYSFKITCVAKSLADALTTDIDGEFDVIFIDAAKAQYIKFFEKFKNNLSKDGVIITDNLSFHGMVEDLSLTRNYSTKKLVKKIRKYIEFLKANPEFKTEFFKVGDGVSLSRRSV